MFQLLPKCLCSGPGVAAGLPACCPSSGFFVISFRAVSFCVRSGRQGTAGVVNGHCPSAGSLHHQRKRAVCTPGHAPRTTDAHIDPENAVLIAVERQ